MKLLSLSAVATLRVATATNTYTSCCSYDGGITCSGSSWCDASEANCNADCGATGGVWAQHAMDIDKTYLQQKSVCDARYAQAGEELGHACIDWNAGSQSMEAAAMVYAQRLGLGSDATPIFAVGSVGHAQANYHMGKCFQFTLAGVSRPLLLQAVNEGDDVDSGNVDVMMGAGGEGLFNGCTGPDYGASPMFGSYSYPSVFGDTTDSGGPEIKADCAILPDWPAATDAAALPTGAEGLTQLCEASFGLSLRPANSKTEGNPSITSRAWVPCPDELVAITQLKRTDEPSAAVDEASQLTASSHATRMMDCCKPSAGFVGNVPSFDQDYPAVLSCKADGFTRMDGSFSPYAGGSTATTTAATTAAPATTGTTPTTPTTATAAPATTTTTAATSCTVKFWEGNTGNRDEWEVVKTVANGQSLSINWKNSGKNDEMTSLCISQTGCTVTLYKNKNFRGNSKSFTGTDTKHKGCGTFFSKSDFGAMNDAVTSFKITAASR